MQSGAHAAHTIERRVRGDTTMKPFHYRDLGTLAVISRFRAVAHIGPVQVGGFIGWTLWLVVHVTFLTGFKNRFAALARWTISFVGRGRYERALTGRWVVDEDAHDGFRVGSPRHARRKPRGNAMPINVTPIAGLSDHINDIRIRTARIVNEEILPNEAALWSGRRGEASDEERAEAKALREKVQARVKSEGLWAPHLPPEYGGMGIDFMAHAYMNEILAYAVGAASLFGVVAPNSGNQTILAKYGTDGAEGEVAPPPGRGDHAVGVLHDRAGERRLGPAAPSAPARCARATSGSSTATSGSPPTGLAADFFIVMCRAAEPGSEDRPGRMMQVIVPTSTPGVTVVRGIGIWGSTLLGPLRGPLRQRPGAGGERPGPGRATATAPRRTGSAPGGSSTA